MSYLDRFNRFAEGAGSTIRCGLGGALVHAAVSLHGVVLHFYFAASKFPFLLANKSVTKSI